MIRKIVFLTYLFVIAVFLLLFHFIKPYYNFAVNHLHISPLQILLGRGTVKNVNNRINILILGIAGGEHDGPLLTDSIIVAQYDAITNTLNTVGLPRDIWSDTLRDKINSAYAYGEEKQNGGGLTLAKSEIGSVIGQPIQYGIVINFDKFTKLIDVLDGIEVDVEHTFTDPYFPIAGKENEVCYELNDYTCRYEAINFRKGLHKMDGETALKFVRSRYSDGDEGTDFARSKRQQRVMNAIKNKFISLVKEDLKSLSLERTEKIIDQINTLVIRDISNSELGLLGRSIVIKRNFSQNQNHLSSEWFEVPTYDTYQGKYVLIPLHNDYQPLHKNISCLLNKNCS